MIDHSKVVFVGQGPNQECWVKSLWRYPSATWTEAPRIDYAERRCAALAVTGTIGYKLGALIDPTHLNPVRIILPYGRRNLNARWNGKKGKGDVFDRAEGRTTADQLRYAPFTHYILLGAEVARAFGVHNNEWLSVIPEFGAPLGDGNQFLIFPHPSGINTWWNDRENTARARRALRSFLGIEK